MSRTRVVLTFEGTYPYETGGVSTWADILVNKLKNIDFTLLPIMMHPYIKLKFVLPANVTDITLSFGRHLVVRRLKTSRSIYYIVYERF